MKCPDISKIEFSHLKLKLTVTFEQLLKTGTGYCLPIKLTVLLTTFSCKISTDLFD
jgi:hypothetical protein